MSPAIADIQSPPRSKSTHLPNPSPKHSFPTNSNTNLNFINASKLRFDCSNYASDKVTGRSKMKKHVKVRKQSSSRNNFVFGANIVSNSSLGKGDCGGIGEKPTFTDFEKFDKVGFMSEVSNSRLVKGIGSEQIKDSRNGVEGSNLGFVFCGHGKTEPSQSGGYEFGKFNDASFVFGVSERRNTSNTDKTGLDAIRDQYGFDESDSILLKSMSSLNLETRVPHEQVRASSGESKKAEEGNKSECRKFNDLDFVFSANGGNLVGDLKLRKEESEEKVEESVPDEGGKVKLDFGKFGDVSFVFGPGWSNLKSNSTSDTLESNKKVDNVGFESLDDNIGSVLNKGGRPRCTKAPRFARVGEGSLNSKHKFGFESSNLGSAFGNSPVFNIHDPAKVSAAGKTKDSSSDSCANSNYVFVFGSDNKTASSTRSSATTSWDQLENVNLAGRSSDNAGQKADRVDKVHVFGNNEKTDGASEVNAFVNTEKSAGTCGVRVLNGEAKSSGIFGKEDRPINLNAKSSDGGQIFGNQPKTGTNEDSFLSSSSSAGLCFVPRVGDSEAAPTNRVEKTTDFSFTSSTVEFGASFAGFSTPNLNMSSSFTADLFPGLSKKLEFNANNSVGEKRLKKTRAKLRQQQRSGRTHLSKEGNSQPNQESPGYCSPMDVSPYHDEDTGNSKSQFQVPLTSEKSSEIKFSVSTTSCAQTEIPAKKQQHQQKYKMKFGGGLDCKTTSSRVDVPNAQCHGENTSNADEAANQEACTKWRIRGNQAYKDGDRSKAEAYYTTGIDSIPHAKTSGLSMEPLLLCYSNRAVARMSLGRMREALEDCRMAASLNPNFIKVLLRAANCHLVLGELEDALYNYNKCLESGNNVCLDRRITIEAADGLQKAQKVATCMNLSAELLQQRTFDSASNALENIADALSISCYSEKLLEMKGDALFMLRKHEEVVQLCEQTLGFAERNFATVGDANHMINVDGYDCKKSIKLWRWNVMSKSYFHLGRLEKALDLIEKQEQLRPIEHNCRTQESSIPLAVIIRELLHCKNAGNEAFQSGRHTEAIDHYTTAISRSIESRPFAAVCFCNRAAARQTLGEIIDAISDCSIAIALDGSYPKALSRRATLHEMIRDYEQATNDLRRLISVLEMQSQEKSRQSGTPGRSTGCSAKDFRRARRRLSSIEEKAKKEMTLHLYLILGLKTEDPTSEVKKAYRKAALRHHPDKAGQFLARSESGADGPDWKLVAETIHMDADRLFKMIGEAYAVLSDSTKRSKYDLEEELRDDEEDIHVGSSFRRPSNSYTSPFESRDRRHSQESRKTYGNSNYHNWQESRKTYGNSHPRW